MNLDMKLMKGQKLLVMSSLQDRIGAYEDVSSVYFAAT
jgi:hypothetical protein